MLRFYDYLSNEDGQGMVEYGLIIGFIAIVCLVALSAIGTKVENFYNKVNFDV